MRCFSNKRVSLGWHSIFFTSSHSVGLYGISTSWFVVVLSFCSFFSVTRFVNVDRQFLSAKNIFIRIGIYSFCQASGHVTLCIFDVTKRNKKKQSQCRGNRSVSALKALGRSNCRIWYKKKKKTQYGKCVRNTRAFAQSYTMFVAEARTMHNESIVWMSFHVAVDRDDDYLFFSFWNLV